LSEIINLLLADEPTLHQALMPTPPTLTRLLALKDSLLIPDRHWEEVVDTFNIPHASLAMIQRYCAPFLTSTDAAHTKAHCT
jgi:hypothetical protein